jgi:signal transducing adaptor molecule
MACHLAQRQWKTTHEKVKRRALGLIAAWTAEFENDPTLGVMEDCYNNLKAKSNFLAHICTTIQRSYCYPDFKFEVPQEAPPPTVDDDVRRREEEELQRVLEMSMQDKGGRNQWQYSAASSSGAGGSGSQPRAAQPSTSTSYSAPQQAPSTSAPDLAPPSYSAGYVRAQTPPPKAQSPVTVVPSGSPPATTVPSETTSPPASEPVASLSVAGNITVVTRVRALHTFEPTEPGELAFEKGDIIKVVDRGYKDWWRGQLKGRTGIFPVNYVVSSFVSLRLVNEYLFNAVF